MQYFLSLYFFFFFAFSCASYYSSGESSHLVA
jgi:hypothetical protein